MINNFLFCILINSAFIAVICGLSRIKSKRQLKKARINYLLTVYAFFTSVLICLSFDKPVLEYKKTHNDFELNVVIILTIWLMLTYIIFYKYVYKKLYFLLIFVLCLFGSCGNEKPLYSDNTTVYSVDSIENIEEHLYNEWE